MNDPAPPKPQEVKAPLNIPQESIAKLVMGDTQGAQPVDYSGNRLDPIKAEQLYEKLYRMRLRGVENKSLLSRALGVSYNTIASWCVRFDSEMRRMENSRSDIVERNVMVEKFNEVQQTLWQIASSDETSAGVKVSAMNAVASAIFKQAELMGLLRDSPHYQQLPVRNYLCNEKEIARAQKLALGIKALIAQEVE